MTTSCVSIIIRPRRDIATRDPHPGDARVVKDDAKERKAGIARRGWDEAAKYQLAVSAKVLDQRAGFPVSVFFAGPVPIRMVHVCEDRAEPGGRRVRAAGARHEEVHLSDVAFYRAKEPHGAERLEDGFVGRVAKGRRQASEWGLHKPVPGVVKKAPRFTQEAGERRSRNGGCCRASAVPVDLAATTCERPYRISVVGRPQRSPVLVDRALNRGYGWSGRLEHSRRTKSLPVVPCVRAGSSTLCQFVRTHQDQSHQRIKATAPLSSA